MDWIEARDLFKGRSIREGLSLWFVWIGVLTVAAAASGAMGTGRFVAVLVWGGLAGLSLFVFLRFFRDFTPRRVERAGAVVSPAHGVVDAVELTDEPIRLKRKCRRISIYLSLRDVHVQNAPMTARMHFSQFVAGARRRAIHADAGQRNEALLLHFRDEADPSREVLLKLIAGVFVRRIVPWIAVGDFVQRGQRISLIRFGSRVDVYLPSEASVLVKAGDRVVGSETVLASFPTP